MKKKDTNPAPARPSPVEDFERWAEQNYGPVEERDHEIYTPRKDVEALVPLAGVLRHGQPPKKRLQRILDGLPSLGAVVAFLIGLAGISAIILMIYHMP